MNKGSHGIGLNICKRFAELLGGDLYLNEEYHQGSEFILKLVLKRYRYANFTLDEELDCH
jgi:signal transduction histidine kinase